MKSGLLNWSKEVNLSRRIEELEKEHIPKDLSIHLIGWEYGESEERAKQRYCDNNEVTIEELENLTPSPCPQIIFLRPLKAGDIK